MFKRRAAQPQQEQRRQIGQPQLLHTTYDRNLLSAQSAGGLTASSAPSEYFQTPLDALSSNSLTYRRFDSSLDSGPVFQPGHRRDVSSVYSRPSQDEPPSSMNTSHSVQQPPQPVRQPSSVTHTQPYAQTTPTLNIPDSAGTITPNSSEAQNKKGYFGTHIPTLRKQKSSERRPPESETRWDEYRGEPVRSGAGGKPGSVRPDAFAKQLQQDPRYQVKISGGVQEEKAKKSTWGERAAKITKDTFDARPPWKGGSGRNAIVDPVKDTAVPRSSPKYTAVKNTGRAMQGTESDNSLGLASSKSDDERNMSPVSSLGGRYEEDLDTKRNDSTRDFDDNNVSPIATTSKNYFNPQQQPQQRAPAVRLVEQPQNSPTANRVSRKPVGPRSPDKENKSPTGREQQYRSGDQPQSHFSWTTYAESNADARSIKNEDAPPVPPLPGSDDPVSRFSWTTVNTSTTYQQDSPPPSPPPDPVPQLDAKAWRNVGVNPPKVPEKPPTPPPADNDRQHHHPTGKALPQAPANASKTMNHVELLTAQETDLALRRRNIQRVIKELEKIDSASPLDVDWKTAKANKKNLEERHAQLSEVEREQHELGLAIARARRKAEREEGIESGLWVRRVTG